MITDEQIDLALALATSDDPHAIETGATWSRQVTDPVTGHVAVLRELREQRKRTSEISASLTRRAGLLADLEKAFPAMRSRLAEVEQERDRLHAIVRADSNLNAFYQERFDRLRETSRAHDAAKMTILSEANEARDLLVKALDHDMDERPIGLLNAAEWASEELIRLRNKDANHNAIVEVARGVSSRQEVRIAELEASALALTGERDDALAKLDAIAVAIRNAGEAQLKLETRIAEMMSYDSVDEVQLIKIGEILDAAAVEFDEDPSDPDDAHGALSRVRILVAQRNDLASIVAKTQEQLTWLRDVTQQRDAIIASEYMGNVARYTKPDGTRMSELEILPAIIAHRDQAMEMVGILGASSDSGVHVVTLTKEQTSVTGRITVTRGSETGHVETWPDGFVPEDLFDEIQRKCVGFEQELEALKTNHPGLPAVHRNGDVIAQAHPDLTTTIMLEDAARALGWRTDFACGDSPITWTLVMDGIRKLKVGA